MEDVLDLQRLRKNDAMADLISARAAIREALLNDCIYLHPLTRKHLPQCRQGDVHPTHWWLREM